MYHVHSSSLSSSTSTTEAVSSLPPHVLFPFFQPPPPPSSSTASPTSSTTTTTTSSSSTSPPSAYSPGCPSCPTSVGGGGQPFPALPFPVSPNFISLPSSNSYQSILLPLPTPVAPFAPAAAAVPVPTPPTSSSASSSAAPPSAPSSAAATDSSPTAPVAPLLVFSHGSTAVDTYVPSSRVLQRTLYTWSQLSDYTVMHCWLLPSAATSSASFPNPSSLSFTNGSGRLCGEAEVAKCPGHPWVNYSYHMQVKQWQEHRTDDMTHTAATHQHHTNAQSTSPAHPSPPSHPSGDAMQRREGGWLGHMAGKVPEVRVLSPAEVFSGRRRGMGEEEGEDGLGDASEAEGDVWHENDWDDVCTTEGEEDDDQELTDVDM